MLDRAAIMRDAHRWARHLRDGERCKLPARRAWPTYAAALAYGLCCAWQTARRQAAAQPVAVLEVEAPLPADVARQVDDLHIIAGAQPFNSYGAARFRAIRAEADDIARAARCAFLPAPSQAHAHA